LSKKNKKPTVPTEEAFLQYIPVRGDFEWSETDRQVHIVVPKFHRQIGEKFCKLIKKESTFTAHLDAIGSVVWKQCDGKKTVEEIRSVVRKQFPEEKNIDQRLYLFLQQMHGLNYLLFHVKQDEP